MELYWQETGSHEYNDGPGLDLDEVWGEASVFDAESFRTAIFWHIAVWCVENGYDIDTVEPSTFDHGSSELAIKKRRDGGQWDWLDEVCKLYIHISGLKHSYGAPEGAVLGFIENVGWDFFDFDSGLSDIDDRFHQEFDGDYEEFAKEWMDKVGEDLPEHLTYYFNYREYGEHLVEDYELIEWDGEQYLFSQ